MDSQPRPSRIGSLALWLIAATALTATPATAAPDAPLVIAQASDKTKSSKTETKPAAKPDKKAEKSKTNTKAKPDAKPAKNAKDSKDKKTAKKPDKPGSKTAAKPGAKPAAALSADALKNNSGPPADPVPASAGSSQGVPAPATTIITAPALDVAALKRAVEMVRSRKQTDAGEVRKVINDAAAKKLVEWVILRSDDSGADFARYTSFITANPTWPSIVTLRRKAEAMAFQDQPSNAQVQAYFGQFPPLTAKGRFAMARALLAAGQRKEVADLVRDAWRHDSFSQEVENRVTDAFGEFLTREDHKARMDRRLYEKDDTEAGVRAAARLGGNEPLIAKARISMMNKGSTKAAMDAVPAAARNDVGYKFARIQMLRRADETTEAAAVMKTVPQLDRSHDLDEWWIERRLLARKLLDEGHPKEAYAVCRDATPAENPNYRAEQQFMAGWIALRYLNDPTTAYTHFLKVGDGHENPIALSRGAYWSGRAAEALNKTQEAKKHYQEAARFPTAYYGQLGRGRLGLSELALNPFPTLSSADRNRATSSELVRAAELLYAIEARELAWTMMADLGDKSTDIATLVLMAELTAKYRDARGMLLIGKLALARGYPLDHAAFPTLGVPDYTPMGPEVEPALVYSIVRQESWFNPKTISSANALGLMQVTPAAGKYLAGKFKASFDQKRLLNDQVYNVQFGAAELGDNIQGYRGSYIMAFAGYNAGRGRVKEWVSRYGDPRDPKVDPIDWVERIPFSETRNYVQRVMENFQVYRVRFNGPTKLTIEADLKRGAETN